MRKIFTIFFFILVHVQLFAQDSSGTSDTLQLTFPKDSSGESSNAQTQADTTFKVVKAKKMAVKKLQPDSLFADTLRNSIFYIIDTNKIHERDTFFVNLLHFSQLDNNKKFIALPGKQRVYKSKDHLFYVLAGLVFLLALLRLNFTQYFDNVFSLSFQVKFRQSQTRDLLLQNQWPAFLLNLFFMLSAGLFITLLAQYYNWVNLNFWLLFLYSTFILAGIYVAKYLFINFTGWIFKAQEPAASYNFIVFLINKVLGIILLPCTILFAFGDEEIKKVVLTVAGCVVFSLFAFRYIVSLLTVKRNLNITAFHFFLYLCAVEVMPMLIIYKLLFLETSDNK